MVADAAAPAGTSLSMTQLAGVIARYFPPEARATAVAISWHESRGNTRALNDQNNTPPGSRDRGLWQINSYWNPGVSDECAFDADCSTAWAAGEYKARGWKAWATFARGAYRPFLEQAEAAVEQAAGQAAGSSGGGARADFKIPGWIPTPTPGEVIDTVGGAAGAVIPDSVGNAFKFIGRTFEALTSGKFWKRIGLGYAGVSLVIVAIIVVKRDTIAVAAGGAAGGPAGAAAADGAVKAKNAKAAAKKETKVTADAGAAASPKAVGAAGAGLG